MKLIMYTYIFDSILHKFVSRGPFYVILMGSHVVPQKFSQTIKLIRESKIAKMPKITLLPM